MFGRRQHVVHAHSDASIRLAVLKAIPQLRGRWTARRPADRRGPESVPRSVRRAGEIRRVGPCLGAHPGLTARSMKSSVQKHSNPIGGSHLTWRGTPAPTATAAPSSIWKDGDGNGVRACRSHHGPATKVRAELLPHRGSRARRPRSPPRACPALSPAPLGRQPVSSNKIWIVQIPVGRQVRPDQRHGQRGQPRRSGKCLELGSALVVDASVAYGMSGGARLFDRKPADWSVLIQGYGTARVHSARNRPSSTSTLPGPR